MNYFQGCKTIHEAKARFRELAKKHHPDAGGDAKVFAEISNQMDAFMPSQPEHSNYYGNKEYTGFEDAFNSAYTAYGASGYRFNATNRSTYTSSYSIPFDHPIHEELRQEKKLKEFHKKNFDEIMFNYEQACKREANLLLKIERMQVDLNEKDNEICSLKAQIEVLSSPQPSCSILDKIRSYFEKPSQV